MFNSFLPDRSDRSPRFRDASPHPNDLPPLPQPPTSRADSDRYLSLFGYSLSYEDARFAERFMLDAIDVVRSWQREKRGSPKQEGRSKRN